MRNPDKILAKARKIHGKKYGYKLALMAERTTDKVPFICPIHGEFIMSWDSHISKKSGCPKCHGIRTEKYTTEEWVGLAKDKHKEKKYDYSEVEYRDAKTKVKIICHEHDQYGDEHGAFYILPPIHLRGVGCPKCGGHVKYDTNSFAKAGTFVHKGKYSYEKTVYVNSKTKVIITCPLHGDFEQNPTSHLQGCGCPKCNSGVKSNSEEFAAKARIVHKGYYTYEHVKYVNAKKAVWITCPLHGDFEQTPDIHLRGFGCPQCSSSILERIMIKFFRDNNINYVTQYKVKTSNKTQPQRVDFYIPQYRLAIECQGEQHFNPCRFGNQTQEQAENALEKARYMDKIKYDYCKENNIRMIYFVLPYRFYTKVDVKKLSFYADKTVLTSMKEVSEYFDRIRQEKKSSPFSVFDDFAKDFSHTISDDIILKENQIQYQDIRIIFQPQESNEQHSLNDICRDLKKRDKKSVVVFYDEYIYKRDLVIDKLKHILQLDKRKRRVHGRNCQVQEISKQEAEIFLNQNHIQGYTSASVYLGTFHSNELVGVMTFLLENTKTSSWNLNRFATNIKYTCNGLGGKLFKHFIRNYEYREIKSFADRRWTVSPYDNLYIHLGFKFAQKIYPSYQYVKADEINARRIHKFLFRKHILSKKFGLSLTMTENEMTKELGYIKIWDCGLYKYVYINPDMSK